MYSWLSFVWEVSLYMFGLGLHIGYLMILFCASLFGCVFALCVYERYQMKKKWLWKMDADRLWREMDEAAEELDLVTDYCLLDENKEE